MDPTFNTLYPAHFEFYMYRSGFTETYRRYYPRIDSMLRINIRTHGTSSLLLALFCAGYNGWLMEKHIKRSLDNDDWN